jgi:dimeric dUTPase (all-alpha-NTP-PPase superfamily)
MSKLQNHRCYEFDIRRKKEELIDDIHIIFLIGIHNEINEMDMLMKIDKRSYTTKLREKCLGIFVLKGDSLDLYSFLFESIY